MKKYICILLLILTQGYGLRAQQSFTYSQYMYNLTPRLPVASLLDSSPSLSFMTRQQWAGIDGAPKTSVFTGALPLSKHNLSAGMFVLLDEVAVEKNTEVNFFLAKGVQLTEKAWLSVSLNGGIRAFETNYASLDPTDQAYRNDVKKTNGLLGLSMMLYAPEKYYIGISLPQARMSRSGFALADSARNWKSTWVASAGFVHAAAASFDIRPAALLIYSKDQKLLDVSATFYWMKQLGVGVSYRTSKEVSGIFAYTYKHQITVGYSYTLAGSGSEVSGMSDGSHELMLRYRFGKDPAPRIL